MIGGEEHSNYENNAATEFQSNNFEWTRITVVIAFNNF